LYHLTHHKSTILTIFYNARILRLERRQSQDSGLAKTPKIPGWQSADGNDTSINILIPNVTILVSPRSWCIRCHNTTKYRRWLIAQSFNQSTACTCRWGNQVAVWSFYINQQCFGCLHISQNSISQWCVTWFVSCVTYDDWQWDDCKCKTAKCVTICFICSSSIAVVSSIAIP